MLNTWNIRNRAHECARTGHLFEEGESFHTAIYFDTETGEFVRRDICLDAWEEELKERTPFSSWKSHYEKPEAPKAKVEITQKEGAESLLRRLIDEDHPATEHARYILALMLERKKLIVPKERKENENGIMLIYEHRKTGEVFILRDPELRLDEVEGVQQEVATLLGFAEATGPGTVGVSAATEAAGGAEASGSSGAESAPESGSTAEPSPAEADAGKGEAS
jgi:hypothetical protein